MFNSPSDIENYFPLNGSFYGNEIDDNCINSGFPLSYENSFYEEKQDDKNISTNYKSNSNECHSDTNIKFSKKESSNDDNSSINYFPFDEIKDKFPNFKGIFKKDFNIEKAEKKLSNIKTKRDKNDQDDLEDLENLLEKNENQN